MPLLSFVLIKQYSAAGIRMSVDFMFHYYSQTCILTCILKAVTLWEWLTDRLIQVDRLTEVWKT